MNYLIKSLLLMILITSPAYANSTQDAVDQILHTKSYHPKQKGVGKAPINIALCKYWGKRDLALNLPYNSSLSIALPYYTTTTISINPGKDQVFLHGAEQKSHSSFYKRVIEFIDLFRAHPNQFFKIETYNDIPTAAGFASSASGFAALIKALDDLFEWKLTNEELSILARMGSGSAARSIYSGFVYWQAGEKDDGSDSYAKQIKMKKWNNLRLAFVIASDKKKDVSSRDGMNLAVDSSPFYKAWLDKVNNDLRLIKPAILEHDIKAVGKIAESDALAMHSTAITSWPPVLYWNPLTIEAMQKVWKLREDGIEVYFTMDAGSSLILLFEKKSESAIERVFPNIQIIKPLF